MSVKTKRPASGRAASGTVPSPDVREIAAQADAAGMSYGQYVAAKKGGNAP